MQYPAWNPRPEKDIKLKKKKGNPNKPRTLLNNNVNTGSLIVANIPF